MSDPLAVLEVGDVIITVTAKSQGAAPALVPPRPLPPVLPERFPRVFHVEEMRRAVGLWVMATAAKCYKRDWPRLAEIIREVADRLAGEPENASPPTKALTKGEAK